MPMQLPVSSRLPLSNKIPCHLGVGGLFTCGRMLFQNGLCSASLGGLQEVYHIRVYAR